MSITGFIKRHPVSTYFALAFAISWIEVGILFAVAPGGSGTLIAILVMVTGPSMAGVVLTRVVDGREGLLGLFSRLCRWRVNVRWYGAALFITPLLLAAILFALGLLVSPVFTPSIITVTNMLGLGIVYGLFAGFFEEIGWTGYALPKVQLKHNALTAGLMVGVVWGLWHFLPDFLSLAGSYEALYPPHFLLWVVALIAYRVLIAWVYNNRGSLLLAQLMHASFTGSQFILGLWTPVADCVRWYAVFMAGLWVVVAAVVAAAGKHLVREHLLQPWRLRVRSPATAHTQIIW